MAVFENIHFGNLISDKLSNYLKEHTSTSDRMQISIDTGISLSNINYVIRRVNTLSVKNSVAILELMRIAVINCTNEMAKNKQAKRYFVFQLKED